MVLVGGVRRRGGGGGGGDPKWTALSTLGQTYKL